MTIVNTETGEIVEQMTADEARHATERIRLALDRVSTAWADLSERIADAYHRRADKAMGYESWAAYAEAELQPPSAIAAEVRRELVAKLSAQGLSTRAIAPTVGVSNYTVSKDRQVLGDLTPDDPKPPAFVGPGERIRETTVATRDLKVVGLDGKTYERPEQSKPRRRPLPDAARDAGWDLRKTVERVERITDDDRFTANKDEVATQLRGHLTHAIEVCQDLLDRIN